MGSLIKETIRLAAQEIEPGTSVRLTCPKCGGGRTKEKSFSILRERGRIIFKCFRDNCNLAGIFRDRGGLIQTAPPKEKREYLKELGLLRKEDLTFFQNKFNLGEDDLRGVRRCLDSEGRFLLPVVGPSNQFRGYILRSFNGGLKAITYKYKPDQPFIGHFSPLHDGEKSEVVVVVEDWFSACKVAKAGLTAITINGTHISWESAAEIAALNKHVILALDQGTLPTALGHAKKFGGMWPSCQIWLLGKDLKYEKEEKIINAATNRKEAIIRFDK